MENRISVIIPVYNVRKYIEKCLDSILNQTVPFDEIIVVNDGSTDGSEIVCRKYQSAHPGIILIEQKNLGLSEARNRGMKRATGDYIVFVDSDDWVSDCMCETIKSIVADRDLDVVYYAAQIVKETPVKISSEAYARDEETSGIVMKGFDSLIKLFPSYYQMSVCMAAYKRVFLKEHGIDFIKDILYEDRFFSLRVVTEAEMVVYITDHLYIRRFRPSSIVTSPASRKKIRDVIYGHLREWQYIRGSENWIKEKSLTQYYVLCGAVMAHQNDVSSENTQAEGGEYLTAFFKEWMDYFEIDIMGENELCELLLMVNRAAENGNRELIEVFDGMPGGGILRYQERIRELLEKKYKEKLGRLPFREKKQIALYGAGKHTDCLLWLYQYLIGVIVSEIDLIVSTTKVTNPNNAYVVRCLDEITDQWDIYILSSGVYQEEMYQNLRAKSIPEEKIYRLYDKNDAVDCVMVYEALFS